MPSRFVVYIAGPYEAPTAWQIEQNIRRAEEAALEIWRAGGVALCPHTNARNFHGEVTREAFLEGDLELLRRCDAVLMLAGWTWSRGANGERDEAMKRGMPVYYSVASCKEALHDA